MTPSNLLPPLSSHRKPSTFNMALAQPLRLCGRTGPSFSHHHILLWGHCLWVLRLRSLKRGTRKGEIVTRLTPHLLLLFGERRRGEVRVWVPQALESLLYSPCLLPSPSRSLPPGQLASSLPPRCRRFSWDHPDRKHGFFQI